MSGKKRGGKWCWLGGVAVSLGAILIVCAGAAILAETEVLPEEHWSAVQYAAFLLAGAVAGSWAALRCREAVLLQAGASVLPVGLLRLVWGLLSGSGILPAAGCLVTLLLGAALPVALLSRSKMTKPHHHRHRRLYAL